MASEPPTESSPTPKLSLFSLPSQPPEPPGMLTPPLQMPAAIPFQWEEAPGKPRPFSAGDPPRPKAARSLGLPPKLVNEEKIAIADVASPTTVLDGPYCVSHTLSFSIGTASFRSSEEEVAKKQSRKERWDFGSWRWGSSKSSNAGEFEFSASDVSSVNITRIKKRSSFFGSSKSQFWASVYENVKHAVQWKRGQEKLRKKTTHDRLGEKISLPSY
ncbi:hypothetical protein NMG60_11017982 [Bertholletia excelsa]